MARSWRFLFMNFFVLAYMKSYMLAWSCSFAVPHAPRHVQRVRCSHFCQICGDFTSRRCWLSLGHEVEFRYDHMCEVCFDNIFSLGEQASLGHFQQRCMLCATMAEGYLWLEGLVHARCMAFFYLLTLVSEFMSCGSVSRHDFQESLQWSAKKCINGRYGV